MKKGKLFTLEGIEACGKSTVISKLHKYLPAQDFIFTHEPGGTRPSEDIRNLLLNKTYSAKLAPETQALLFAASRTELNNQVIKPRINQGKNVIIDRYLTSSLVYQGILSKNLSLNWVKEINKYALKPDLVFFLDIDPKIAAKRMEARPEENFMDLVSISKQESRRKAFLQLAKDPESHICVIDANQGSDKVTQDILKNIFINI